MLFIRPIRKLCILFHYFSFLPPLFVLTLTALYVLKFPNQFFIFFRARVRQPLRRCHKAYEFCLGAVLYSTELDTDQHFLAYPFVNALRTVADQFRRRLRGQSLRQLCPLRIEPPPKAALGKK